MILAIDLIILLLILFYFYRGYTKGFLRSILGPISLVIGIIASYAYYLKTDNFIMSLVISILGPFAIHIALSILLKIWHKVTKGDEPISPVSGILGGSFSVIWSGTMLVLTLTLVMLIPLKFAWLTNAQNTIGQTTTYAIVSSALRDFIPQAKEDNTGKIQTLTSILEDKETLQKIDSTPEYKKVMSHKKIRTLLRDSETRKDIEDKNFINLLSNKNVQSLLEDKELIADLMALNKRILTEVSSEE